MRKRLLGPHLSSHVASRVQAVRVACDCGLTSRAYNSTGRQLYSESADDIYVQLHRCGPVSPERSSELKVGVVSTRIIVMFLMVSNSADKRPGANQPFLFLR